MTLSRGLHRNLRWFSPLALLAVALIQNPCAGQIGGNRQSQAPPAHPQPPSRSTVTPSLPAFYYRWLNEDVRWIITNEEIAAFKKLASDSDRDLFIEQFWKRRDPTPDTEENEYREEHYRRFMYANERLAGHGVSGWHTDRGRVYIMYGKPDAIDSHPQGRKDERPPEEGGSPSGLYPFEVWKYRYLDGIGKDVEVEFADSCRCGDYKMTLDHDRKDAIADQVAAPPNVSQIAPRTSRNDLPLIPAAPASSGARFKDLAAIVDKKARYNLLPFDIRVDFVKVTYDTVWTPITIQVPNREITFAAKDGVHRAAIEIYGRLTSPAGKTVTVFEEPLNLDVPEDLLSKVVGFVSLYQKALPLSPGMYRLDLVIKDVNGNKLGTEAQSIRVPQFAENQLGSSTLILADLLGPLPSREVGTASFVLGAQKVRPRVGILAQVPTFKRDQKINFWMQVYNLTLDEKSRQPSADVEYQVVNASTSKPVVDLTENTSLMAAAGDQITLAKAFLPPSSILGFTMS